MSDSIPSGDVQLTRVQCAAYRVRLVAWCAADVGVPEEMALAEVRRAYQLDRQDGTR